MLLKPAGKGEAIQILKLGGAPEFERDREFAACAELCEKIFETLELVAIFLREADSRLDALLPASVQEKALLGSETEVALFPLAIS